MLEHYKVYLHVSLLLSGEHPSFLSHVVQHFLHHFSHVFHNATWFGDQIGSSGITPPPSTFMAMKYVYFLSLLSVFIALSCQSLCHRTVYNDSKSLSLSLYSIILFILGRAGLVFKRVVEENTCDIPPVVFSALFGVKQWFSKKVCQRFSA